MEDLQPKVLIYCYDIWILACKNDKASKETKDQDYFLFNPQENSYLPLKKTDLLVVPVKAIDGFEKQVPGKTSILYSGVTHGMI